jgi:type I restriction enzyme R subunit
LKAKKDALDKAAEERLKDVQDIADEAVKRIEEPEMLFLTQPGEYALFSILRAFSASQDTAYLADCARNGHTLARQPIAGGRLESLQRRTDAGGAIASG